MRNEIDYYGKEKTRQVLLQDAHESEAHEWQLDFIDCRNQSRKINRILEIGCGMGRFSFALARKFKEARILATDIVPSNVAAAKKFTAPTNLKFEVMDIMSPGDIGKFDIIFGGYVLHHLPDLNAGVENIVNMLADRGWYFGLEPNFYNPYLFMTHSLHIGKSPNEHPVSPHAIANAFIDTDHGLSVNVGYFFPSRRSLDNQKFLSTCIHINARRPRC